MGHAVWLNLPHFLPHFQEYLPHLPHFVVGFVAIIAGLVPESLGLRLALGKTASLLVYNPYS